MHTIAQCVARVLSRAGIPHERHSTIILATGIHHVLLFLYTAQNQTHTMPSSRLFL